MKNTRKRTRLTSFVSILLALALVLTGIGFDSSAMAAGPISVSEAIANNQGKDVTVQGYLIGSVSNGPTLKTSDHATTNLMLAESMDETDETKMLPVQLPKGSVRNEWNLAENPEKLGSFINVTGDLEAYFGAPGLKNTSAIELVNGPTDPVEENPIVEDPIEEPAPVEPIEEVQTTHVQFQVYLAENGEFPSSIPDSIKLQSSELRDNDDSLGAYTLSQDGVVKYQHNNIDTAKDIISFQNVEHGTYTLKLTLPEGYFVADKTYEASQFSQGENGETLITVNGSGWSQNQSLYIGKQAQPVEEPVQMATLTYDFNREVPGVSVLESVEAEVGSQVLLAEISPDVTDDYSFMGYDLDGDGKVDAQPGNPIRLDADTSVTAVWEGNNAKIAFVFHTDEYQASRWNQFSERVQDLSGYNVIVRDENGNMIQRAETNSTGQIYFNGLAKGDYTFEIITPENVSVVKLVDGNKSSVDNGVVPFEGNVITQPFLASLNMTMQRSVYVQAEETPVEEPSEYTVTIDPNGGSISEEHASTTLQAGEGYTLPYNFQVDLAREGYTLIGYTVEGRLLDKNGNEVTTIDQYTAEYTPLTDVTLTAQWEDTNGLVQIRIRDDEPRSQTERYSLKLLGEDGSEYSFDSNAYGRNYRTWEAEDVPSGTYTLVIDGYNPEQVAIERTGISYVLSDSMTANDDGSYTLQVTFEDDKSTAFIRYELEDVTTKVIFELVDQAGNPIEGVEAIEKYASAGIQPGQTETVYLRSRDLPKAYQFAEDYTYSIRESVTYGEVKTVQVPVKAKDTEVRVTFNHRSETGYIDYLDDYNYTAFLGQEEHADDFTLIGEDQYRYTVPADRIPAGYEYAFDGQPTTKVDQYGTVYLLVRFDKLPETEIVSLTYNFNREITGVELPQAVEAEKGSQVTLAEVTPDTTDDYSFMGYDLDGDGKVDAQPGDSLTLDEDMTVTGIWEGNYAKIGFVFYTEDYVPGRWSRFEGRVEDLSGYDVLLKDEDGNIIERTQTDSKGKVYFDRLAKGDYSFEIITPNNVRVLRLVDGNKTVADPERDEVIPFEGNVITQPFMPSLNMSMERTVYVQVEEVTTKLIFEFVDEAGNPIEGLEPVEKKAPVTLREGQTQTLRLRSSDLPAGYQFAAVNTSSVSAQVAYGEVKTVQVPVKAKDTEVVVSFNYRNESGLLEHLGDYTYTAAFGEADHADDFTLIGEDLYRYTVPADRIPEGFQYAFDGQPTKEVQRYGTAYLLVRLEKLPEEGSPEDPTPVEPSPEDPAPVEPTPEDPAPEDPAPVEQTSATIGVEVRGLDGKRTDIVDVEVKNAEGQVFTGSYNEYKQWKTDSADDSLQVRPGTYTITLSNLPEGTQAVINGSISVQEAQASEEENVFTIEVKEDDERVWGAFSLVEKANDGQDSNSGDNPNKGPNPNSEKNPNKGPNSNSEKNPNEGPNPNSEKNPNKGPNPNSEKNPNEGLNPNSEKNPNEGPNPNSGKSPGKGPDPKAGTNPAPIAYFNGPNAKTPLKK